MSGRGEGKGETGPKGAGDGAGEDEFDATFGLRRLTQTELEVVCRRHLRFCAAATAAPAPISA